LSAFRYAAAPNFARYFGKRPGRLTQEHIREYRLYLIQERKLEASTVGLHIAALRFFFVKTLRRPYLQLDLPYPKRPKRLPTVLSQDEVARLIESANNLLDYAMLMTLYATGMRRAELSRRRPSPGARQARRRRIRRLLIEIND